MKRIPAFGKKSITVMTICYLPFAICYRMGICLMIFLMRASHFLKTDEMRDNIQSRWESGFRNSGKVKHQIIQYLNQSSQNRPLRFALSINSESFMNTKQIKIWQNEKVSRAFRPDFRGCVSHPALPVLFHPDASHNPLKPWISEPLCHCFSS